MQVNVKIIPVCEYVYSIYMCVCVCVCVIYYFMINNDIKTKFSKLKYIQWF